MPHALITILGGCTEPLCAVISAPFAETWTPGLTGLLPGSGNGELHGQEVVPNTQMRNN